MNRETVWPYHAHTSNLEDYTCYDVFFNLGKDAACVCVAINNQDFPSFNVLDIFGLSETLKAIRKGYDF